MIYRLLKGRLAVAFAPSYASGEPSPANVQPLILLGTKTCGVFRGPHLPPEYGVTRVSYHTLGLQKIDFKKLKNMIFVKKTLSSKTTEKKQE